MLCPALHILLRSGWYLFQVIVAVVMVAGWPIAHHVWAGNEVDHTTVGKAMADLHGRFGFNRLVFVGDRGMVTSDNLDAITAGKHGYLVGLKRRRNKKLGRWLAAVDEAKWINCPVGITAREKADPPRTRAQEIPSGIAGMRVIIVDSDSAAPTRRPCVRSRWNELARRWRSSSSV